MKILVVGSIRILNYPPVTSLIQSLIRQKHQVLLITKGSGDEVREDRGRFRHVILKEVNKKSALSPIAYFMYRRRIRKLVKTEMKNSDFLWTVTDNTVRDLGNIVFGCKHIMQLQELIEDIPAIPGQRIIWLGIERFAKRAYRIVVPEYNRAQITKAWWNLDSLPYVLPNKSNIDPNEYKGNPPDFLCEIMEDLRSETRKIILYQGVFAWDRDLELYARAIEMIENEYLFVVMGRPIEGYDIDVLCNKYKSIKRLPYIEPPYHFYVTSMAFIGVLPYAAKELKHYSVLNAVYCAPNKLYEYAAFGKPMIGSNVPGLSVPFNHHNCGVVVKDETVESVLDAISYITDCYDKMSKGCNELYESCDYDSIVKGIFANCSVDGSV